jgi:hypothetical protein
MRSHNVTVTPQWAVWGKDPDDTDYHVMRCSDGVLTPEQFSEIINRYSLGTHTRLPQVSISWARPDEEAYLGLAIHEWSHQDDRLGRDIARTRYFAIPYGELEYPVSYMDIYAAALRWSGARDEKLTIPELDPQQISLEPQEQEMAITLAALLLEGTPVHILGGGQLSMPYRLKFLDGVAAFLPYGMRPRFSAATWVSSTSQHYFRLAFCDHPRDGGESLSWGRPPSCRLIGLAEEYSDLLVRQQNRTHLIRALSTRRTSLRFGDDIAEAVRVLKQIEQKPLDGSAFVPTGQSDPVAVLNAYADAVQSGALGEAQNHANWLGNNKARMHTSEERARFRITITERRLLNESMARLPTRQQQDLYKALLTLSYGTELTLKNLDQIAEDAGGLRENLLEAVLAHPFADLDVSIQAARLLQDQERLRTHLNGRTSGELLLVAERSPRAFILDPILDELVRRARKGAVDVAELQRYGFLAHALDKRFPGDDQRQYERLVELLDAVYGEPLGPEELAQIVDGAHHRWLSAAFFMAAFKRYGGVPDDLPFLLMRAYFGGMVEGSSVRPKVKKDLNRLFAPASIQHQSDRFPSRQQSPLPPARSQTSFLRRPWKLVTARPKRAPSKSQRAPSKSRRAPSDPEAWKRSRTWFWTSVSIVVLVVLAVAATFAIAVVLSGMLS